MNTSLGEGKNWTNLELRKNQEHSKQHPVAENDMALQIPVLCES